MNRTFVVLILLLICTGVISARAERLSDPGGSFTLDFPDGEHWTAFDVPPSTISKLSGSGGRAIARRTRDDLKTVAFITLPGSPPGEVIPDEMIVGIEEGMYQKKLMRKISGARAMLHGRQPAYVYSARHVSGAWVAGIIVLKARVLHQVQAGNADEDPLLDPELANYLNSFRMP